MDPMDIGHTEMVINQCLPNAYKNSISQESIDTIAAIKEGLKIALATGDYQRGGSYFTRSLNKYISNFICRIGK
jgi:hypothetical protein